MPEDDPTLRWLKARTDRDRAEQDEIAEMRRRLTAGMPLAGTDDEELTRLKKFMCGNLPPSDLTRALLPPTRRATRQDHREAEANARAWHDYRFEAPEARAWLEAGIYPDEVGLVRDLIEEGISQADLNLIVTHPDTGERLTILEVARRSQLDHRDLCATFDACRIEQHRQPRWWWSRRA